MTCFRKRCSLSLLLSHYFLLFCLSLSNASESGLRSMNMKVKTYLCVLFSHLFISSSAVHLPWDIITSNKKCIKSLVETLSDHQRIMCLSMKEDKSLDLQTMAVQSTRHRFLQVKDLQQQLLRHLIFGNSDRRSHWTLILILLRLHAVHVTRLGHPSLQRPLPTMDVTRDHAKTWSSIQCRKRCVASLFVNFDQKHLKKIRKITWTRKQPPLL